MKHSLSALAEWSDCRKRSVPLRRHLSKNHPTLISKSENLYQYKKFPDKDKSLYIRLPSQDRCATEAMICQITLYLGHTPDPWFRPGKISPGDRYILSLRAQARDMQKERRRFCRFLSLRAQARDMQKGRYHNAAKQSQAFVPGHSLRLPRSIPGPSLLCSF